MFCFMVGAMYDQRGMMVFCIRQIEVTNAVAGQSVGAPVACDSPMRYALRELSVHGSAAT